MKIALPINQKNIQSEVCQSFGRAPFFAIFDIKTRETDFLNNDASISTGGAGIKAAQTLIDNSVSVIIAPRYGENAAQLLLNAGIKVYKSISGNVKENIKAYENNKLNLLTKIHPGLHRHGNK